MLLLSYERMKILERAELLSEIPLITAFLETQLVTVAGIVV